MVATRTTYSSIWPILDHHKHTICLHDRTPDPSLTNLLAKTLYHEYEINPIRTLPFPFLHPLLTVYLNSPWTTSFTAHVHRTYGTSFRPAITVDGVHSESASRVPLHYFQKINTYVHAYRTVHSIVLMIRDYLDLNLGFKSFHEYLSNISTFFPNVKKKYMFTRDWRAIRKFKRRQSIMSGSNPICT